MILHDSDLSFQHDVRVRFRFNTDLFDTVSSRSLSLLREPLLERLSAKNPGEHVQTLLHIPVQTDSSHTAAVRLNPNAASMNLNVTPSTTQVLRHTVNKADGTDYFKVWT